MNYKQYTCFLDFRDVCFQDFVGEQILLRIWLQITNTIEEPLQASLRIEKNTKNTKHKR